MTTKRKAQGGTKGKAGGSKRQSVKDRARAIIADARGYDEETRHSIKNSLEEGAADLAEVVRRAERGEQVLDVSSPLGGIPQEAEAFKAAAVAYARKAYDAALAHFEAYRSDPLRLRRFAFVYGETDPADVHMIVTLPKAVREHLTTRGMVESWVGDAEAIALTLEDAECSDAFRSACSAVIAEHLLDRCDVSYTTPAVLRVLLPLALIECSGNNPVDTEEAASVLTTLREALNTAEVSERTRIFHAYPMPD